MPLLSQAGDTGALGWGAREPRRLAVAGLEPAEERPSPETGAAARASCQRPRTRATGPGPALVLHALGSLNSPVGQEKPKQTNKHKTPNPGSPCGLLDGHLLPALLLSGQQHWSVEGPGEGVTRLY